LTFTIFITIILYSANELSVFFIGDTCGASMSCGVVTILTVFGQQGQ
jgi:hypothetical protein